MAITGLNELQAKKHRSRQKLSRQVRAGNIIRPTKCSSCDAEACPEAHHEDYDKPLDVMWLCRPCHMHLHTMRGDMIRA